MVDGPESGVVVGPESGVPVVWPASPERWMPPASVVPLRLSQPNANVSAPKAIKNAIRFIPILLRAA